MDKSSDAENLARMQSGELYYAFTPTLIAQRERCKNALNRFNHATIGETTRATRRRRIELWRDIAQDQTPLPPPAATEAEDDILLQEEPYVEGPIKMDYGYNVILGKGVFINSDCTFVDTSPITFGARTIVGPNCSFFSGTHPLDPFLRNGLKGPEYGSPITVGEDCWIGGNAIVLPGVNIGRGVTVGAGSVVTKSVEDFCVVAGNPARVIRRAEVVAKEPKLGELVKDGEVGGVAGSS